MACINGFKNSVKTSLLYLQNEIIYFWIWGRKIKDKNSWQNKDKNSLYFVLFDSHYVSSDVIPYGFPWQMWTNLQPSAYLLVFAERNPRGSGDFVSCAA